MAFPERQRARAETESTAEWRDRGSREELALGRHKKAVRQECIFQD